MGHVDLTGSRLSPPAPAIFLAEGGLGDTDRVAGSSQRSNGKLLGHGQVGVASRGLDGKVRLALPSAVRRDLLADFSALSACSRPWALAGPR